MQPREFSKLLKSAAAEAGFDLCGIAPVCDFPELGRFPQWIAKGHAGEMKYLESRDDSGQLRRASLNLVFPWARSVVVCALNYNTEHPYSTQVASAAMTASEVQPRIAPPVNVADRVPDQSDLVGTTQDRGWISRYAWSREDYHDSVLRRLREVEAKLKELDAQEQIETRSYVDTGPIVERVYAKYAGIGWLGKNTCLINQQIGSWLFLGVIITSVELTPDLPAPDRCGTCTRCIDACPTNAFVGPRHLDANRCLAYLTIEKRGAIPEELRAGVGHQVFGCDICQDVCPWNRKAPATDKPEFQPRDGLVNPALEWMAEISEEDFREVFRGSPVKRAKRNGLRRNALIAIGNSQNPALLPVAERAASDPDPTVAEAAEWARDRMSARDKVVE